MICCTWLNQTHNTVQIDSQMPKRSKGTPEQELERLSERKRKADVCLKCTLDPDKYCNGKECPKVRRA